MANGPLSVTMEDTSIVVSMPGTAFSASFFRPTDEPRLIQSPVMSVEKEAPSDKRRAFEVLAWEAANLKARELGWIV